ncbi:MAG: ABC transporter substrate-binding protein [Burkholderiaceae bacterium]|nr:ABC transporter substrate-binding protein [Burkholderiaceae bacterium]
MLRRAFLILAGCLTMALSAPIASAAQESPEQFVQRVSEDILSAIRTDERVLNGDRAAIEVLVDNKMMPAVDFLRMTRMAVGPKWRTATPAQRDEMQSLFRQILINVYAGALSMAKDQSLKLLPHGQNDGTEAIVRTAMLTPGKPDIQMVYRLRNIKEKGWRVIDVNVEGVWLVSNYRNQFGSIAASEGIEGLIKKMQERVKATK